MGAWHYMKLKTLRDGPRLLGRFPLYGLSRPVSASPATGSHSTHKHEQERLIQRAFSEDDEYVTSRKARTT